MKVKSHNNGELVECHYTLISASSMSPILFLNEITKNIHAVVNYSDMQFIMAGIIMNSLVLTL